MSNESLQIQLEATRKAANPFETLYGIAKSLRDSGTSQTDLYCAFTEFFKKHSDDNDQTFYEIIADVLDCIWSGGWGGNLDLFDEPPKFDAESPSRRTR